MADRWRQTGRGMVLLFWVAVVLCIPRAGLSLDLRVQGRSELDAGVTTAGPHLVVQGKLRDDLNQPLPRRNVGIAVYDESERRVATRTVQTDRRGTFATRFDLAPGEYRVTLRFESTTHVTGTVFDETVEVRKAAAELQVGGPTLVHGEASPVHLGISATVGGVGLALPVEIRAGGDRYIHRELDDSGRLRVDIAQLLEDGTNRVEVTIPGGDYRDPVTETLEVRKVERLEVEGSVEPVFERLQRGAAVDGTVRDERGPISGARITAIVRAADAPTSEDDRAAAEDHRFEASGETDPSGRFHIFFGRDQLSDGEWHTSVRVEPEVGTTISREIGSFEIDRSLSRMIVNGAAVLAILALLVVVGRESWDVLQQKFREWEERRAETERRRRAFEQEQTLEAIPVAPDGADESGEADRREFRGEVWDAWEEGPVEGATVALIPDGAPEPERTETTGEGGHFAFGRLEPGQFEIAISARYYVRGRFAFEIPHDGSLANCRFELVPVPLKIRRLYQSLVELARGDDLWGRLSPREIRTVVAGVLEERPRPPETTSETARAFVRRIRRLLDAEGDESLAEPSDYLEALTDIVQETYFGPRRYDETTWELAREIALRLREELEGDDET